MTNTNKLVLNEKAKEFIAQVRKMMKAAADKKAAATEKVIKND